MTLKITLRGLSKYINFQLSAYQLNYKGLMKINEI
jgi:hypothetical protein